MAKKPSRSQRKQIRERHERAQAHGLPGRALERPSKPAPSSPVESRRAQDSDPDADGTATSDIVRPPPSLLDKLKQLPLAVKLGALVVAVLALVAIMASQRKP
jgi:hypothetical protein